MSIRSLFTSQCKKIRDYIDSKMDFCWTNRKNLQSVRSLKRIPNTTYTCTKCIFNEFSNRCKVNDKERVAAALEKESMIRLVDQCINNEEG